MKLSGTSFAAPIVAGMAAQILARRPTWTPDQVKGALMMTGRRMPDASVLEQGRGEVNLVRRRSPTPTPNPNAGLNRFVINVTTAAPAFPVVRHGSKVRRGSATRPGTRGWDDGVARRRGRTPLEDGAWAARPGHAAWQDAAWSDAACGLDELRGQRRGRARGRALVLTPEEQPCSRTTRSSQPGRNSLAASSKRKARGAAQAAPLVVCGPRLSPGDAPGALAAALIALAAGCGGGEDVPPLEPTRTCLVEADLRVGPRRRLRRVDGVGWGLRVASPRSASR